MKKKLTQITSLNIFSALINFGLNFFLARYFGNEFFGEFSLFNAKTAILGLIFIIIPSNYAVVKFQDDDKFKSIYFSFYILGGIFFLLELFVAHSFNYLHLPVLTIFLFSYPSFFLNFFDCALQADNKLNVFSIVLFFQAFVKTGTFFLAFETGFINDLGDVILSIGIGNFISLISLFLFFRKKYFYRIKFIYTIKFIVSNLKNFKGYYLNNIIKSLADNFYIFLFNSILNKSQLGLFSLFIKAQSFSFSLFRVLEAFLVNRNNNKEYYTKIYVKKHFIAVIAVIMTFLITIIYIYLLNYKIYVLESLVLGIGSIFYIDLLMLRTQLILSYNNSALNLSIIIEMITMFIVITLMHHHFVQLSVLHCIYLVFFSSLFRVLVLRTIIKIYQSENYY